MLKKSLFYASALISTLNFNALTAAEDVERQETTEAITYILPLSGPDSLKVIRHKKADRYEALYSTINMGSLAIIENPLDKPKEKFKSLKKQYKSQQQEKVTQDTDG